MFQKKSVVRQLNNLIGGMDLLTGILLLINPTLVIKLLLIPEVPSEIIYLQFIGAFVGSVGGSYLISGLYYKRADYLTYVKALWLYTSAIRTSVGIFLVTAISLGELHPLWLTVALTDISVAIGQWILIQKNSHD